MVFYLEVVIGILILIIGVLVIKLFLMQRSADEIAEAFAKRLEMDTNTLIDVSSRDSHIRKLAAAINVELRSLRRERHRFQQGDQELKNAITNISHDLRTPLTALWGYLELLKKEKKSETVEHYLAIIENRAQMLKSLTEELFCYSVTTAVEQKQQREKVVVQEVLQESIAAFYAVLKEHHITPDIQMPEQKLIRYLDRSALSRVLANLLNNAVKYSDGDLVITLTEAGEILFENKATKLDEVQLGKLFDRFYTVEEARNSTGLGLSIARNLVEQMEGSITADYIENRLRICIVLASV